MIVYTHSREGRIKTTESSKSIYMHTALTGTEIDGSDRAQDTETCTKRARAINSIDHDGHVCSGIVSESIYFERNEEKGLYKNGQRRRKT